ncbi:MAG: hypothetical protein AABY83_07005 [Pseudomonadota bacterium]
MNMQLRDVSVLSAAKYSIDAKVFNTFRLASLRLKTPIRLMLPGLRTLDMLVDHSLWLVVDRSLDDLPIVAWDQFDNRSAIHSPVTCRVRYFHFHAAAAANKALQLAYESLSQQLEHLSKPAVSV